MKVWNERVHFILGINHNLSFWYKHVFFLIIIIFNGSV